MRKKISVILVIVLGIVAVSDVFFGVIDVFYGVISGRPRTTSASTYRTGVESEEVRLARKDKEIQKGIETGHLVIGMTKAQVRRIKRYSSGPEDINTTHTSWGESSQYCYPNGTYLYFENGILTSWQD